MADLEVYKNLSPEKGKSHTTNFKVSGMVLVKDGIQLWFYVKFKYLFELLTAYLR